MSAFKKKKKKKKNSPIFFCFPQHLNKTMDIFAINIATNDELYALSTADCDPCALHAKLVAAHGATGFEFILRPIELTATKSPQSPTASTAIVSSSSPRSTAAPAVVVVVAEAEQKEKVSTRSRRSQTMPDNSHALDFLANLPGAASAKSKARAVEEPAVVAAKGKSSSRSHKQRRPRHGKKEDATKETATGGDPKTPEAKDRRKRTPKKSKAGADDDPDASDGGGDGDSDGDEVNWVASPRGGESLVAADAATFVHDLDAAQISAIANKQYANLASPKTAFNYLEKPRDADVRKCYEQCVQLFNESGTNELVEFLGTHSADNAVSIAQVLYECEPQLDSVKLGEFLSDDTPLSSATLRALMSMFPQFKGAEILSALRRVIRFIRLPSEAQRLTRYLTAFCETYVATNPKQIKSADHAFTLCYALLSLNAATHSPDGGGKRFSNAQFEAMLEDVLKGEPQVTLQSVRDMRENVRINEIVQQGDGIHSDLKRRGWLEVQQAGSLFSSGWKRKWCVLAHNVLYVAKEAAATELISDLWTIPLRNVAAVRGPVGGHDWALTLLPVNGDEIEYSAKDGHGAIERRTAAKLVFSTTSAALLKHWIDDINEMVQQHSVLFVNDDRVINSATTSGAAAAAAKTRRRRTAAARK
jgi:hypothetical protein